MSQLSALHLDKDCSALVHTTLSYFVAVHTVPMHLIVKVYFHNSVHQQNNWININEVKFLSYWDQNNQEICYKNF